MKGYLPYNKNLKQLSRDLRNHSTKGEILLWQKLRARSFMGYQFYRQKPIDNFIVDFYCQALRLVIEVDGDYHNNEEVYKNDITREEELKKWGLNFLRFKEIHVRSGIDDILHTIENYIRDYETKDPDCLQHKYRKANPPTTFTKE
ncbi:MAG: endonuclease domain-containing protein [Bacteroidota bacterium]|nr:endonuclease domain-containing protein [Bacteroidota bacterium]